jgi:hypothetical protein
MKMEHIFTALLLLILLYELVALGTPQQGDTISEIVWRVSSTRPILPFAVGVLCGHFFWPKL